MHMKRLAAAHRHPRTQTRTMTSTGGLRKSEQSACASTHATVPSAPSTPCHARAHTRTQGDNCWVFVNEEDIQDTVKTYFKFEEELFSQAKKTAAKGVEVKPPTTLSTIVMDAKLLTPKDVSAHLRCACGGVQWAAGVVGRGGALARKGKRQRAFAAVSCVRLSPCRAGAACVARMCEARPHEHGCRHASIRGCGSHAGTRATSAGVHASPSSVLHVTAPPFHHAQLKACEKIPTKKQLLATIAMLAKQPATKLATGIKQVPTKLAVAIKQVSTEGVGEGSTRRSGGREVASRWSPVLQVCRWWKGVGRVAVHACSSAAMGHQDGRRASHTLLTGDIHHCQCPYWWHSPLSVPLLPQPLLPRTTPPAAPPSPPHLRSPSWTRTRAR